MNKAFIIFLAAAAFIWSIIGLKSCSDNSLLKEYKRANSLKQQIIEEYKDKEGKNHKVIEALIAEKQFLKEQTERDAKALGIKNKQVKGRIEVVTEIDTIFKVDSVYRDTYITIIKEGDSVRLALKDTLKVYQYWKRKWFLSSKNYFIDVSNSNHYIKVKDINMYEIKQKKPKVIIGPSLQYNPFVGRLSLGVSILYYPLTLKL